MLSVCYDSAPQLDRSPAKMLISMLKLFFPISAGFGGPLNSIIEETASSHGLCSDLSTSPEGASCCKGCLEGVESCAIKRG